MPAKQRESKSEIPAENETEEVVSDGEVVKASRVFDFVELSGITSFEDAYNLAAAKFGEDNVVLASDVLGDGFKLLETKDRLIDVPFIILAWDFNMGEHGEFATLRIVTSNNEKYVVNDGSTGIRDQLIAYQNKTGRAGGMMCKKGFRRSDYTFTNEKGELSKGTTFYIDTSA